MNSAAWKDTHPTWCLDFSSSPEEESSVEGSRIGIGRFAGDGARNNTRSKVVAIESRTCPGWPVCQD